MHEYYSYLLTNVLQWTGTSKNELSKAPSFLNIPYNLTKWSESLKVFYSFCFAVEWGFLHGHVPHPV